MTTYGAIPTSEAPAGNAGYLSFAKEQIGSGLGIRRPWKEMLSYHAIILPSSIRSALQQISFNIPYFRMNYAMIVLFILFASLLWHPISLIVLIAMMAAWLFLYFLWDKPLVILARLIGDGGVLVLLSVLTLVFLFLTDATVNILVGLAIGAVVVLVHAAFRATDDLFVEEDGGLGQIQSGGYARMPLKDTASASFSS